MHDTARCLEDLKNSNDLEAQLSCIMQVVYASGIPSSAISVVFNCNEKRADKFHLKCFVPPVCYRDIFLPWAGLKSLDSDERIFQERFAHDSYLDRLKLVQAAPIEADNCPFLLACGKNVLNAGAVALFKPAKTATMKGTAPSLMVTVAEAADAFERAEAAVEALFGKVWFSLCYYPTEQGKGIIGVRLLEKPFSQRFVAPELQAEFEQKWIYVDPKRTHHKGKGKTLF